MAAIELHSVPAAPTAAVVLAQHSGDSGRPDYEALAWLLKNLTGTATVWVHTDPTKTTAVDGWPWAPADGPLKVTLEPGEALYGRTLAGSAAQDVRGLRVGR
jgi:hypothetical protein